MSGHDFDNAPLTTSVQQDVVAPKGGGTPPAGDSQRPAAEEIWKSVEKILNGTSRATHDLPRLVSLLDDEHKNTLATEHYATLGRIAPGDIVLEVGRVLEMPPFNTLRSALAAKTAVSSGALRTYVQSLDGSELAAVTGEAFTGLKRALGGKLLDQLPGTITKLESLDEHGGFIEWFVETTPPAIVAYELGRSGTAQLAKTLEGLTSSRKWEWVDHVHLAQGFPALADIASAAPDPIKQKLQAKLGPIADEKERERFRHAHKQDVAKVLDSHGSARELLDAIARAGDVSIEDSYKVLDALAAMQVSADDVLAVTNMIRVQGAVVVHLLLRAKDVTPQHLQAYLFQMGGVATLAHDAKLLREIRKRIPQLRIGDLLQSGGTFDQRTLIQDEMLQTWFLESAAPSDLLWFCGGEQAARACKLLDKRDPSWRWVYELSANEPARALRAVALNCPLAQVSTYVRNVLLAEPAPSHQVVEGAEAPAPETKTGETGRLLDAMDEYGDVLQRIADLDETKRAKYGRIDAFVAGIGTRLGARDFARAAVLLQLDFGRVVAHCPSGSGAMVAYLRTRPRSEEVVVLGNKELLERALERIHPDPLVVFPSLYDAEQLARSIERVPKLVELMFKHSEPNTVADLLSRQPVIASTERILDKHPELLDWLPRYRHMSKRGKEAVDRLANPAQGDVSETLHEIRDNAYDPRSKVREQGTTAYGARKEATAAGAVQHVLDNGGTATTLLGVLTEYSREQQTALLTDPSNHKVVIVLAAVIGLPPHIVFPQLSVESLLSMPNARAWLFDYDSPTLLLDLIANRPAALAKVAAELDHETGANAQIWLGRLPVGNALTDAEVRALDRMQPGIKNTQILNALFAVRFGIPVPSEWSAETLAEVYRTLCRLPRAHLDQERIKAITVDSLDASKAGLWTHEKIVISDQVRPGSDTDNFNPDKPRLTKAQIQRLYGWNDAELAIQVKLGNVRYSGVAADQYEVVADKIDKFTSTLLHEIGHSIDDILGRRTDPVFKMAQWRSYAPGDVDKWAAEMGGWDKVTPSDQKKIAEVWLDSIRSGAEVYELVDADHPAMAARYDDVGIVRSARDRKSVDHDAPLVIGERAFIRQRYYGQFFSVAAHAVATKPSTYSLYAPAEYFAECYVEYYKEVDGSPNSRAKKGGALPQPIKNWFTNNVDTLKYDPQRFQKPSEEGGGD